LILVLSNFVFSPDMQFISAMIAVTAGHRGRGGVKHEMTSSARSNTGVVGSNPTRGMDVYSLPVLFYISSGLAAG
jgi:hypothetical protein